MAEALFSVSDGTESCDQKGRRGSHLTASGSLFTPVVDVLASFLEAMKPERMGGAEGRRKERGVKTLWGATDMPSIVIKMMLSWLYT